MANAWSITGKRLELKPGFPAGKLVLDGETAIKLKAKGSFPLQIAGHAYTFERAPGMVAPKDTLRSADGQVVPPTPRHVASVPAGAGGLCAQHPERQALVECARCGSYACDLMFMGPVLVFVALGGMLGAVFGFAAGAAVVAVARKTESAGLKWAAAIGLYLLAAIAVVASAGAMQVALGR